MLYLQIPSKPLQPNPLRLSELFFERGVSRIKLGMGAKPARGKVTILFISVLHLPTLTQRYRRHRRRIIRPVWFCICRAASVDGVVALPALRNREFALQSSLGSCPLGRDSGHFHSRRLLPSRPKRRKSAQRQVGSF